ncbi:DNA repair protein RecN [Herbivorax sp. ANBcel31]|uniref:DNA repair protein RecN n=1 Tax=Herbivorax sp. ANBcel31 TaxID=3069754 RepID=UPI0027B5D91F|nr:DNA repair protein RecN [Herbivorax sp. ANBcel31]MDQ2086636.1 DNA repair protein RecN [Herbivorax sp. ANBcel31]
MLRQLEIQNIAIIDKLSIELGDGLNVLTGETGAGKSIIIDSINAIIGQRLSRDLIRTGENKALVEAIFEIKENQLSDLFEYYGIEPEEDGVLVISREFTRSGKNTCRINGKISTVSMLRKFGERLIDVHGQHDNQSLLRIDSHIDLLDSLANEKILDLKKNYLSHLENYKKIKKKINDLLGDSGERERKIDLLKYQIDEVKSANLEKGEEQQLEKEKDILLNFEKIIKVFSDAYEVLGSGRKTGKSALDMINEVVFGLNDIKDYDETYIEITERLESLTYELEDIVSEVRAKRDNIEYNPAALEQVEERLGAIYKLKKKYGDSIEDILIYMENAQNQLDEIINNEEVLDKLNNDLKKENDSLYTLAKSIHQERKKAAKLIEDKISYELNVLEMKNTRFEVRIEFDKREDKSEINYNQNGLDKVEFLISTNAGEPLKPLAKIASGGEMSRIMLAIKTILANVDKMPTLIFDEIDIGISGKAAQKVGEKLSFISRNHQVISVTHLAQIACMADCNYYIQKITKEKNTKTIVTRLEGDEIKNEIARIIGGENISQITIKHAEEMLEFSRKFKQTY